MSKFFGRRAAPAGALLLGLWCNVACDSWAAWAQSHSPSETQDVVRRYEYGIFGVHYQSVYTALDDALERSVAQYGPYKVEPVAAEMSLTRLHKEALKGDLVNVVVLPPGNGEIDEGMTPIEIPLDKGLWGYQVGLIRAADQPRVDQVRDIAGLRQLRIGDRQQLIKVPIYEYNAIHLVTDARDYESLLQMLERGRFDLISRPVPVVFQEFDRYVSKHPSLAIDRHLLLHYPFAMCVYVSKSAPRLAERIRYGLQEMQQDGSLDRLFEKNFSPVIAKLDLPQRTLIELENPFLPAWAKIPRLDRR